MRLVEATVIFGKLVQTCQQVMSLPGAHNLSCPGTWQTTSSVSVKPCASLAMLA